MQPSFCWRCFLAATKPDAVLITGAACRIGRAIALHLAKQGFAILGHYRSSKKEIASLEQAVNKLGRLFYPVQWDLSTPPDGLIAHCLKHPVFLCGLINNASVFESGSLSDMSRVRWQTLLQVNALSPLQLAADYYRQVKRGCVINVLDAQAKSGNPNFQIYRMTKRFLFDMTLDCAALYAPLVRVNGIAPGAILPPHFDRPNRKHPVPKPALLKRGGSLNGILNAVDYCFNNPLLTGQILYVDGGLHLV
ncbi:MAG: hypothetical protein A2293_02910 [Elusimicrobia bacterium RIFOXYB2_FULL_49_7]|nr:MAG: hypothetical protein A2293_02910 [Elusimicrobia bacterium RIFOXYB2_FULL_49_7]